MTARCVPRYLGAVKLMPVGSWAEQLNAAPALRCLECGGVDRLAATTYTVDVSGGVSPAYRCPTATCGWTATLTLESFGP